MHYSSSSYSLEHHLESQFFPRLSRAICFISGYDKILKIGGIYCLTDISRKLVAKFAEKDFRLPKG
jgi:hypothetical protein